MRIEQMHRPLRHQLPQRPFELREGVNFACGNSLTRVRRQRFEYVLANLRARNARTMR